MKAIDNPENNIRVQKHEHTTEKSKKKLDQQKNAIVELKSLSQKKV